MTRAEKKKSGQCDRRCRRRRMCTDRMNEKSSETTTTSSSFIIGYTTSSHFFVVFFCNSRPIRSHFSLLHLRRRRRRGLFDKSIVDP